MEQEQGQGYYGTVRVAELLPGPLCLHDPQEDVSLKRGDAGHYGTAWWYADLCVELLCSNDFNKRYKPCWLLEICGSGWKPKRVPVPHMLLCLLSEIEGVAYKLSAVKSIPNTILEGPNWLTDWRYFGAIFLFPHEALTEGVPTDWLIGVISVRYFSLLWSSISGGPKWLIEWHYLDAIFIFLHEAPHNDSQLIDWVVLPGAIFFISHEVPDEDYHWLID